MDHAGGVALAYHHGPGVLPPGGVGHYPVRMVLEDRLAGVGDIRAAGGHHGPVQAPPTQILHSILSMKVSRHELGSQSPPGHGYMPPAGADLTWGPPPQYPTPPSSHSSSPGPQVLPPSPPAQGAPASPAAFPGYGDDLSPPCRQGHDDIRDPEGDAQPMDLKKKRRCAQLEFCTAGEEPMDLSCPKKLRLSSYSPVPSSCSSSPGPSCSPPAPSRSPPHSDTFRRRSPPVAGNKRTHLNKKLVYDPSDAPSNESLLRSILVGQLKSRSASPTPATSEGGEGATSAPYAYSLSSSHGLTRSPQQRVSHLLEKARRLQQQQQQQQQLQQQRRQQQQQQQRHVVNDIHLRGSTSCPSASQGAAAASHHSQVLPVATGSERLTCPTSSSPVAARLPRHTEVSLAKKNLLPVSARVSEWLLKAVEFAKALPEFQALPLDDKLRLISSAWSRLLLLQMAETNFEFAVNPCPASTPPAAAPTSPPRPGGDDHCSRLRPTVGAVEGIESFLRKCQTLEMTSEEITLLKLLSLFNPSYQSMSSSSYIEKVNTHIRKCLQDACAVLPGRGKLRYSQLLLVLPPLFGVRPKVVEALFCQHITVNTHMELLLSDMLHKL